MQTPSKDIYLIRHGQSTGNTGGRMIGWSDHALTALGRRQAAAVAARLAPLGPMPVICSDLQRACETASTIAARWGGEVTHDQRWREICCGVYEDCTWEEFNGDAELQRCLETDPLGTCMPEGESIHMVVARVTAAFTELCARPEPRLAVVTHDGGIRSVLAHCLQLPAERFWTIFTEHAGLTLLRITGDWVSVRTVNDTNHLADLAEAEA